MNDTEIKYLYPLCVATGNDGNEFKEKELEDSLTVNQKVELKLKAGIEPTIYEERMCTLPYALPGEIWRPIVINGLVPGKFISNKRRIRSGDRILIQSRLGILELSIYCRREALNTNKLVLLFFQLPEIRFSSPLQEVVNKVIANEKLTPDDIDDLVIDIPLPGEEWKPVVGYEGRYEVSNIGRVRSILTNCILIRHDDKGYRRVKLRLNNDEHMKPVHRLVIEAFKPQTEEDKKAGKNEINHINGFKNDDRVENLEWCTHSENILHAVDTGLLPSRKLNHDLVARAVYLYDTEKMDIKDIIALPEFVECGVTYMGMYKAIFRLRYKNFTDIPIPKARPTSVKGREKKTYDVYVDQVIMIRIMKERGFTYREIGEAVKLPMHVVEAIGKGKSKQHIHNEDYPDLVAKINEELDNQ